MASPSPSGVQFRLFLGTHLHPELKLNLENSEQWKQDQLDKEANPHLLEVTHFKNKEYIGYFLPEPGISLSLLLDVDTRIEEQIAYYTDATFSNKITTTIFSIVLLT